jgi:hypothetical protein
LTPKKKAPPKREATEQPKVFLDRTCFITSDGRAVQLCYIHLTEDLKEVEKSGGYYGTVRQALNGYADRVLKGQPSKNLLQLMDLMRKIDSTIEGVVPVVGEALGKKAVPPPAVDRALEAAVGEVVKKKRSKIAMPKKELKLTNEQRGEMLRGLAQKFSDVEILPDLTWREVPDLLAQVVVDAVYNYDPKVVKPGYQVPVIKAARDYLTTNFG